MANWPVTGFRPVSSGTGWGIGLANRNQGSEGRLALVHSSSSGAPCPLWFVPLSEERCIGLGEPVVQRRRHRWTCARGGSCSPVPRRRPALLRFGARCSWHPGRRRLRPWACDRRRHIAYRSPLSQPPRPFAGRYFCFGRPRRVLRFGWSHRADLHRAQMRTSAIRGTQRCPHCWHVSVGIRMIAMNAVYPISTSMNLLISCSTRLHRHRLGRQGTPPRPPSAGSTPE